MQEREKKCFKEEISLFFSFLYEKPKIIFVSVNSDFDKPVCRTTFDSSSLQERKDELIKRDYL